MKLDRYTRRIAASSLLAILFPIFSLAQELPRAKPEDVGMSSSRLKTLSTALDGYVSEGRLAGGVVHVLRKGRLAFSHVFGQRDREARSPMQDHSIFRIASQTKALVSVGIMILQEDGKLLISDPLGKHIPEFAKTTVAVPKEGGGYDVVNAKRQITLRDLLTHTAGISYGSGPARDKWEAAKITGFYFADRDEPIGETIVRMAALPMDAHPGEQYLYGYATDILGVVIERASGQSLDRFLKQRIFDPLDMKDTSFYLPADKKDRLTAVYSSINGRLERAADPGTFVGQGHYLNGPRKSFSGGAGLLSTARDYSRFLQMLLNGGELNGQRVLGRKSVELMTADHLKGLTFRDGQGFGLGFSVVKDVGAYGSPSSVGEYGWGGAYHTVFWVDPKEEMVVVYMTQLIPAGSIDDYGKLRALVYGAILN